VFVLVFALFVVATVVLCGFILRWAFAEQRRRRGR
jgi:hypothetical protein